MNSYADFVLKKCKLHNGPFTTFEELDTFLKSTPGDVHKKLRYEIIFKRQLNHQDYQANHSLYIVNGLTESYLIANLMILLSSEEIEPQADIDLPSQT